ncbi:MAG: hypothetical protein BGO99_08470 [Nitrosospira sp. 56-18]|jgi:hypothetical protein|nr:hypothetical protein [Nitrosospira sp.]OJY12647.1 MAG: hypothetical protein BGO99_08470 [Nitrosospira sp. 56-18]
MISKHADQYFDRKEIGVPDCMIDLFGMWQQAPHTEFFSLSCPSELHIGSSPTSGFLAGRMVGCAIAANGTMLSHLPIRYEFFS